MNSNKNIFYEQQLFAIKIADIYNPEIRKKIMNYSNKKSKTFLPSPESIFNKDIVIDNDLDNKNNYKKSNKYYNSSYSNNRGYYNYYDDDYYEEDDYNDGYYYDSKKDDDGLYKSFSDNFNNKNSNKLNNSSNSSEKDKIDKKDTKKDNKDFSSSGGLKDFKEFSKDITPSKSIHFLNYGFDKLNTDPETPTSEKLKKYFNRKELYRKRDKSRFNFVSEIDKNHDENIIVPDYINDLICDKVSKITFFKIFKAKLGLDNSTSILNKESKTDNWAQFLLSCQEKPGGGVNENWVLCKLSEEWIGKVK